MIYNNSVKYKFEVGEVVKLLGNYGIIREQTMLYGGSLVSYRIYIFNNSNVIILEEGSLIKQSKVVSTFIKLYFNAKRFMHKRWG